MAGQRAARYETGAGYTAPATDPAQASVATQQGVFRPAEYRADEAHGLASIGASLGNFFGAAAKTAESLQEVEHRENLVAIQRENEALEIQGKLAAEGGADVTPEQAERWSFQSAYSRTLAERDATELGAKWADVVRNAPKDGSFDYDAEGRAFIEREVGGGTKNPVYDQTLLATLSRQSAVLKHQHDDGVYRTQRTNAANAFIDATVARLQGNTVNAASMDGMATEALAITQGNVQEADQLVGAALVKGITNRRQAQAVVFGFADSEYGKRNPALAATITDNAWKQIAHTQTLDAYQNVQRFRHEAAAIMANPNATMGDVASLAEQVIDSAYNRGAEQEHNAILDQLQGWVAQTFKVKAEDNHWLNNVRNGRGYLGTLTEGGVSASDYDKTHTRGLSALVTAEAGTYQALNATRDGNGGLRPFTNANAATQFAQVITRPDVVAASRDPLPAVFKDQLEQALMSDDPPQAANAYRFLHEVRKVKGEDYAARTVGSETFRRFQDLDAAAGGSMRIEDVVADLAANKDRTKDLRDIREGNLDWHKLAPNLGKDRATAAAKVDEAIGEAVLKDQGLQGGWFTSDPTVSVPDARLRQRLQSEVASSLRGQIGRGRGEPNLEQAVTEAMTRMRGRMTTIRGNDGALQLIELPYGPNEGRAVRHPLNMVGGRPVYAAGRVETFDGQAENTNDNTRTDFGFLAELLPRYSTSGVAMSQDQLSLGQPEAGVEHKGLFEVKLGNDAVVFEPGQTLTMPVPNGNRELFKFADRLFGGLLKEPTSETPVTLPKDPQKAKDVLNEAFSQTGFFAVVDHVGTTQVLRLVYGPRLTQGINQLPAIEARAQATRDAKLAEKDAQMQRFNDVQSRLPRIAGGGGERSVP